MAWHTGSALSQTIFTCLYVDKLLSSNPKTLDGAIFGPVKYDCTNNNQCLLENVLRPYCLALIKCCYFVNNQILTESIYEVSYANYSEAGG